MSEALPWPYRPDREHLLSFLDTQRVGALATLGATGSPHVSTVAFSTTPDLEFIFGTALDSEKAMNINRDPRVGFVVTDEDDDVRFTVQLEGVAWRPSDEEFDEYYAASHFIKSPMSEPFRRRPGQGYYVITPDWLRFMDCRDRLEFVPAEIIPRDNI